MHLEVEYTPKRPYPLRVQLNNREWYWRRKGWRLCRYRTVMR